MNTDRKVPVSRRSALLLAALALVAGSGGAQVVLEPRHEVVLREISHWGCDTNGGIGDETFDAVGDVNGDGLDDLVIADPYDGNNNCLNRQGSVTVVSGRDASPIWKVGGQVYSGRLGWAVAGAGDVNGDGVPDVIACEPWADGGDGRVWVYSGSNGAVLHSKPNPDPVAFDNAKSVSGIADLDGDGRADFIVGHPTGRPGGARVLVHSGASGNILHTLSPPFPDLLDQERFGDAVADVGDATGDGVHDILVGEPNARNAGGAVAGAVYLFSGATGHFVYAIWGAPNGNQGGFGRQVDGVGDQDGDGKADFIVAGELGVTSKVFSGASGALLWSGGYASRASGAGDVNGDGIEDFLVGYPGYHTDAFRVVLGASFATWYSVIDYSGGYLGTVSRAGDVNDDGFADFMVGDAGTDRVFVYLGRPTPRELRRIDGDAAQDNLGRSVSGAGDVDGDGFADVIVGAPSDDTPAGADAGSARVVSGFHGRVLLTCEGAAGDRLGTSVSGAGDVNRDGFDDVIVGAPLNDAGGTNAGEARVVSGRNGSVLFQLFGAAGDFLGSSVADAGDVNGDGYTDVVVGAHGTGASDGGAARVHSGRDGAVLHEWLGTQTSESLGYSVSGAGDVDGDGLDDVIVGAPWRDGSGANSGSATVYSGFDGTPLFAHHGPTAGDFFGYSVSGAGDVNKDGFADVIVGGSRESHSRVRVLAGPTGTLLHEFTDPSPSSQSFFGASVSGAGDVNGDGYDDVIVGGRLASVPGLSGSGFARVYSGFDGGVLLYQFPGDEANGEFGVSVSGAGDVNGDGRDDVIVGAHLRNAQGLTDSGSAFVYGLGYPGTLPKLRRTRVH